jgi:hypothetical protein
MDVEPTSLEMKAKWKWYPFQSPDTHRSAYRTFLRHQPLIEQNNFE